ncbi:MAG: rhomboid family intramembrane serine protease [Planctomycetaceae bacterium]|nr:rhomboid family intramembrane serine protease [Planctomycetales bacterium]MCB9921960.1 rhomboid family intramembrane serine protease [Planctomycetaceae bacterium]
MGIQDRQYYRDEEESRGGFQAGNSTMITKIVAVTVAIYILDMFIGGRDHWLMRDMASGPQDLMRPLYWWRYLTSGFAHDPSGYQHILYNMLSLWFLGRSVEAVYGSKEILRFYLIAIVLGSVTQAVRQYAMVPEAEWARCLGASGAVVGVVMLFVFNFPKQTLLLFMVIPVPAWLVGVLLIGMNLLGATGVEVALPGSRDKIGRVAYDVHLVGVVFAIVYFKFKLNFGRMLPHRFSDLTSTIKPKLRVHDPDGYADIDAEGDALLEKVNQYGIESLSPRERKILEDYSRRMRQKHR